MADGARLRYRIRGAGEPIVLIRPLGGSIALWGKFETILAESLRVLSFDARGTGASSALHTPTTTRAMAADARAVIDHAGVERVAVFGQSLGGMVATWLAIDAAERVTALVLASAALEGIAFSHAGLLRGARFARCLVKPRTEVEACLVARVLSPAFKEAHPRRVDEIKALLRTEPTSRRTLALHALAGGLHAAGSSAHKVKARTLCIAGEHDELLGDAPQVALARAIPGARFETMSGAGHDVTLEAPERVAARVIAFLAERS